jgi:hypothetical protein
MDFLDEAHATRWASVCVFSNLLLILLAIASGVLEYYPDSSILPLILPQTLLIIPLLLQLTCLAVFTFSARSGALQLFKYQLQIPFLGRWMLPIIVIMLSLICLGTLIRAAISSNLETYGPIYLVITLIQLALHFIHLQNLMWGFAHYLWASRPRHYQPIHPSTKATDIKSNIRPLTSSGHLSKAYSSISQSRNQLGSQTDKTQQLLRGSGLRSQLSGSLEIDPSDDTNQVQVNLSDRKSLKKR